MANCGVCSKIIESRSIECHECPATYHAECVGVISSFFYNLVADKWKCYKCSNNDFRFVLKESKWIDEPAETKCHKILLNPDLSCKQLINEFSEFTEACQTFQSVIRKNYYITLRYDKHDLNINRFKEIPNRFPDIEHELQELFEAHQHTIRNCDPSLQRDHFRVFPVFILVWDPGGPIQVSHLSEIEMNRMVQLKHQQLNDEIIDSFKLL